MGEMVMPVLLFEMFSIEMQ